MPLAFPWPADRSNLAVRAEAFGTTADSWEGDNRYVSVCPEEVPDHDGAEEARDTSDRRSRTRMSPVDEKALLQQGIAAARAGDKASARARFRELTAHNFDNELAWLWLASVADTPAHAIACLRRVLQINPAHDKARAALFRVLMEGGIQTARGGDKATAFASFSECATIDPANELVWTWMASTAPTQAQALDALRRVLHINPSHEQAGRAYKKLVVQRGIDLAQAGDADARVVLLEASAVDPENESVWLWLARSVTSEESIEVLRARAGVESGQHDRDCRVAGIATAAVDHGRGSRAVAFGRTGSRSAGHVRRQRMIGVGRRRRTGTRCRDAIRDVALHADTGGMVVEQFRKDGARARAADDGDAGGDAGRVPGLYERREHRGLGAARDRRRRDRGRIRRDVRSGVRARDDSATLDVGEVDEQTLEVAVAQMEISVAEQDAMELSLAPAALSIDAVVGRGFLRRRRREHLRVLGARHGGTAAVRAARDRRRGSRDRRRRNGAACDGGRTGGRGSRRGRSGR